MRIFNDLRYAHRHFHKNPALTATILATLALCIGANTAIFSIVDQVFFRSLNYPEPDRLVMVVSTFHSSSISDTQAGQNGFAWELIRDHVPSLQSAVYTDGSAGVNLFANNHVEFVQEQQVGAGFFGVLGRPPLIGREFTAQEDISGGAPVVILSYPLWKRLFQGNPSAVGQSIDLQGAPHIVIGVMPRDFHTNASDAQIWTPLAASSSGKGAGTNYRVVGRIRPGATISRVNAELAALSAPIAQSLNVSSDLSYAEKIVPLQAGATLKIRPKVKLIWAAVSLILLIGCINIAGILLAHLAARSHEVAVRLAIGAARRAVIGQVLTESVVLSLTGGVIGFFISYFVLSGLNHFGLDGFVSAGPLRLDLRIFLLTAGVSILVGLFFGLLPALEVTAIDLRSGLAEGSRGSTAGRRRWKRQSLIFAEIALSVVLVISAGLLIRTLASLLHLNPGFDPQNVMSASLSLKDARYRTATACMRLFRDSLDRMSRIPGVESAAVALSLPYQTALNVNIEKINGHPAEQDTKLVNMVYATPSMLETLRMPLLRDRFLADTDTANSPKVAVVDQAFINSYLPRQRDPIGQQIQIRLGTSESYLVVGVIHDVLQQNAWGDEYGVIAALPQIWVPAAQFSDADSTWFISSSHPVGWCAPVVRSRIWNRRCAKACWRLIRVFRSHLFGI